MSPCNEHNEAVEALTVTSLSVPAAASTLSSVDVQIDPALLYVDCLPARNLDGSLVSEEVYPFSQSPTSFEPSHLTFKRREPLRAAYSHFKIRVATRSNLDFLWSALLRHWYPTRAAAKPAPAPGPPKNLSIIIPSRPPRLPQPLGLPTGQADQESLVTLEAMLMSMTPLFGAFDTGGLEDEDEDEELDDLDDLDNDGIVFSTLFILLKLRYPLQQRSFSNEVSDNCTCVGRSTDRSQPKVRGKKTQKSIAKSWNVFLENALATGKIRDDMVDEHALSAAFH
ncbi:hypothetical protein GALMADRAFT_148992 [Galerina marginata CBS 339.88]|uniref:Uncharacterized protein n=1 Tax=Galerina marginata (strain CBS 339.88) TaxID=685588 RepID=A0A067S2U3_GALM3|nr:hypothetical protein GALMADRAFT_148992 [Galerina marginata CBS 339.88]